MSELTLEVEARSETGKNANRRLRTQGQIPAVVYGEGKEPVAIQVERRKVEDMMRSADGENTVFQLALAGTDQNRHAMIREVQSDPIRGDLIHLDFQRIDLSKKVRVMVPIELIGHAAGVRSQGGLLDFVTREIEVECLPGDIPSNLELEVTELEIGDHLEAKDVELPAGVELLAEPDRVLVAIHSPSLEVEEDEEEEELLEAQAAEPEVVGRTKDEDAEDKE